MAGVTRVLKSLFGVLKVLFARDESANEEEFVALLMRFRKAGFSWTEPHSSRTWLAVRKLLHHDWKAMLVATLVLTLLFLPFSFAAPGRSAIAAILVSLGFGLLVMLLSALATFFGATVKLYDTVIIVRALYLRPNALPYLRIRRCRIIERQVGSRVFPVFQALDDLDRILLQALWPPLSSTAELAEFLTSRQVPLSVTTAASVDSVTSDFIYAFPLIEVPGASEK